MKEDWRDDMRKTELIGRFLSSGESIVLEDGVVVRNVNGKIKVKKEV